MNLLALAFLIPALAQPELPRAASPIDASRAAVDTIVPDVELASLDGEPVLLSSLLGPRPAVIIMSSVGCPLCRTYAPRLASIEQEFAPRGIAFVHVNVVDGESRADKAEFVRNFGLSSHYVNDSLGSARRTLRPRTTTEVYVLDRARRVVYHGAVDDQFRLGGRATKITRHYLREAISAVLSGQPVKDRATSAPGCLVDLPAPDAAPGEPFYPRIAALVQRHCADCHGRGGAGPFTISTPADIEGRAAMMAAVIDEGIMPPNHALSTGPGTGRELPAPDRDALLAWLRSARAVGDASTAPPQKDPPTTWAIGRPDIHVLAGELPVAADGPPGHQRSLTSLGLDADTWVQAIECRPVMRDSIQLALVWLLLPGEGLPTQDQPPPGGRLIATYSPGEGLVAFRPGDALRVPAGSALLTDVYSKVMGRAMTAQLRIAMKAAAPPRREVRTVLLAAPNLHLPPNSAAIEAEAALTVPHDLRLLGARPVMRWRGRTLSLDQLHPDGPEPILTLDRYEPRWLLRYTFPDEPTLAAGTRIVLRATFDNSAANPANPDSSVPVSGGFGYFDDSLMLILEYAVPLTPQSP
ncbi:MAG: hypothetical protein DYG92_02225 [Leptolyngbya sp. PLA1]|nr:hypothetical protein [Leptolyngbya sp. PLA1]